MKPLTPEEIAELRRVGQEAQELSDLATWLLSLGASGRIDERGELLLRLLALPRLLDEVEERRACDAQPANQIVVDPGGPLSREALANLRRACEGSHGACDLNEFDGEILHALDEVERSRALLKRVRSQLQLDLLSVPIGREIEAMIREIDELVALTGERK